jgi:hypothetical protein
MISRAALPILACLGACAPSPVRPPPGLSTATVRIDAAPAPAWIFVDGAFIGLTPIEPTLAFTHATHFIEVVALPLHGTQTRQVLRVVPPNLPRGVQFFLDNQDPSAVSR